MRHWGYLCVWLAGCALWSGAGADAANVVLKVRAVNPSQASKQEVTAQAYLPEGIGPTNVVDLGGMDLRYDVQAGLYRVSQTLELEPGEVRTFSVVLEDVWVIPSPVLDELREHADMLRQALEKTWHAETSRSLEEEIQQNIRRLEQRQQENRIGAVKPIDHIRAHAADLEMLERVRQDVGHLENLAIGAGIDPGRLRGTVEVTLTPEGTTAAAGEDVEPVVFRVEAFNPSETETRTETVRRDLPVEVKPEDVVEAEGFEVRYDFGKGVSYLYREGVELRPGQRVSFDVKVRNRWHLDAARIEGLEGRATNLLGTVERIGDFPSVEEAAREVLGAIEALRTETLGETLDEEAVARFRRKRLDLDAAERRLVRIEKLIQTRPPMPKIFEARILRVQPPDPKTTWVVIWIVLGFLALVSLLFFLRWYGRSKAESAPGEASQ